MNLKWKTGLITGGSSGIGYASAKQLLQNGAEKVIITGQNQERLEQARQSLSEFGNVVALVWKAEDSNSSKLLVDQIQKSTDRLDFVFANAGVCWETPVGQLDAAEIQRQLMINLTAPMLLVEAVVPLMSNGGSIVLTTSCLNELGIPGYAAYSASKAGLRSLARTLSAELMDKKIRVNTISPGPFETPIHAKYGIEGSALDDVKSQVASMVPLKRFGEPAEIVDAVAFLVSDSSSFMLGEEITIDGGWSNL
ncbi:MAG: SDR family oxidoreductase [Cyanobacteria bacterium P01_F01_bin.150]